MLMSDKTIQIIGLIITIIGTLTAFGAKSILEKFRPAENIDGGVLKIKLVGLVVSMVGALMVFLI